MYLVTTDAASVGHSDEYSAALGIAVEYTLSPNSRGGATVRDDGRAILRVRRVPSTGTKEGESLLLFEPLA